MVVKVNIVIFWINFEHTSIMSWNIPVFLKFRITYYIIIFEKDLILLKNTKHSNINSKGRVRI